MLRFASLTKRMISCIPGRKLRSGLVTKLSRKNYATDPILRTISSEWYAKSYLELSIRRILSYFDVKISSFIVVTPFWRQNQSLFGFFLKLFDPNRVGLRSKDSLKYVVLLNPNHRHSVSKKIRKNL